MITVASVSLDDATARSLWAEQQAELAARYGEPDIESGFADAMPPDALIASLVARDSAGVPIGTALVRWSPYETGAGSAEVKRLYVQQAHRGHGHSRVLMGAIEQAAARAGAVRIVLETGSQQPEAIALYGALGYARITPYGAYRDSPHSVCFAKDVPTRVLVINGTVGAGKTTTASACHDTLVAQGARAAYIDADFLCQAEPALADDPYNQRLLFENLAGVAPNYRHRGYGCMVIARVVEDPADRERYARAFSSTAGSAQVSVVRVSAPEDVRLDRVAAREPEGYWRDKLQARTVELEANLDALDLDDATVSTVGRDRLDVARQVLAAAGWD